MHLHQEQHLFAQIIKKNQTCETVQRSNSSEAQLNSGSGLLEVMFFHSVSFMEGLQQVEARYFMIRPDKPL